MNRWVHSQGILQAAKLFAEVNDILLPWQDKS